MMRRAYDRWPLAALVLGMLVSAACGGGPRVEDAVPGTETLSLELGGMT
jgi:hypothetical protein